jgi:NodT family efflux transporter outer membrane factor (OMF) lipoprotein
MVRQHNHFDGGTDLLISAVDMRTLTIYVPLLVLLPVLPPLGGCTVGPDYVKPELASPDAWHTALIGPFAAGGGPSRTWWREFDDPVLDQLIEKARQQIAMARIAAAAGRLGIAEGQNLPGVSVDGDSTWNRFSEDSPFGQLNNNEFDLHRINLHADWEIDLFGGIRRQVESEGAAYEASIEDYRDLMVVLQAEVASNYTVLRTLQSQIRYTEANIEAQQGSLTIARDRNEVGLVPDLDVAQAESNLSISRALLPELQQQLQEAKNRIAVLLGEPPRTLDELLEADAPIPVPPTEVAVGIPADLLRQRPDIRAAERRLASQHATIGVVEAQLYPRFFLFGDFGFQATDPGSLFDSGNEVYTFGPGFRWNIWQGGRIRSLRDAAEANTDAALAQYEQALLLGFEEVENALYGFGRADEQRVSLDLAGQASERAVELVMVLYRAGLVDFQNVLDAQRSLLNVQNDLARSEGLRTLQLVNLYRALGGGWENGQPEGDSPEADEGDDGEE